MFPIFMNLIRSVRSRRARAGGWAAQAGRAPGGRVPIAKGVKLRCPEPRASAFYDQIRNKLNLVSEEWTALPQSIVIVKG